MFNVYVVPDFEEVAFLFGCDRLSVCQPVHKITQVFN